MSVFNKNTRRVLSYDVRKRGMTKRVVSAGVGIDPRLRRIKSARHKHFVVVLCKQQTTDAAVSARLDACRRSSRLYFSHFATSTVDNTVDLYAVKLDTRPESRFLLTPPAFDAPVRGFPSEYRHPVWHRKTRMAWLPDGEKISKISLFVLTQLTNVTDTQTDRRTDTQTPRDQSHGVESARDGIGRAYVSRGKK